MSTGSRHSFKSILVWSLIFATFASVSAQGTEKVLYSFKSGSDGANPQAGVIAGPAGYFYGTTAGGGGGTGCANGAAGCGTIFKLAPDRTETVLHAFTGGCDGAFPFGGLTADNSGNYYGTTMYGGDCNSDAGSGTIFKLASDGSESVLYAFQGGSDGLDPEGDLTIDKSGNLFGTTEFGGNLADCSGNGCGTIFTITAGGAESVLYSFQAGNDGAEPLAGVIMDKAGNIYGTTAAGGNSDCDGGFGCGTLFKLEPNGAETVLYAFQGGSDGSNPKCQLVADDAGNLYGTTMGGGTGDRGTVFKLSPGGTETILHSFQGTSDGSVPFAGVIRERGGALYGTTFGGGSTRCGGGCGTVFKLAPDGTETVLSIFKGHGRSGANPVATLLMGKNGLLYGTTLAGGTDKDGVVFTVKTK